MGRAIHKLTALAVDKIKKPGTYGDGGGLHLHISEAGSRSWLFRYRLHGRRRDMGLGPLASVTLAMARKMAADARGELAEGRDPIEARNARQAAIRAEMARGKTFEASATAYIEAHKAAWRSAKHGDQWANTLAAHAADLLPLPVSAIETAHVVKALESIWSDKPETARRVRQRIEAVLDWATARGFRTGANPARWRGHLKEIFPSPRKVRRVQHHRALPYTEVASFVSDLRKEEGVAARALEFTILTATRTSEAVGARWTEVDLKQKVWTVPADRIKAGRIHRVPLSEPALAILKEMAEVREGDSVNVFPGGRRGKPLSNNAMLALLRRMDRQDDTTVHGFRSTFRNWVAERTGFPREVAEAALAHVVADKVEAAYKRTDFFDKRVRLMAEWAKYCGTVQRKGDVVPIRQKESA